MARPPVYTSVRVRRGARMHVTERARTGSCCSRCFLLSIGLGKARLGRPNRSRPWSSSPMARPPVYTSVRVSRGACTCTSRMTEMTYDRDGERARNGSCCSRCFLLSIGLGKARPGRPTRSWPWLSSPMARLPVYTSVRVSRGACMNTSRMTQMTYDRDGERARNGSCCSRCLLLSIGLGKARLGRPTRC
jgi:predicted lipoprotein with Yx(FWY)xxD motif